MILLIGLLGLLLACATKPVTEPVTPEALKPVSVEVAKEGWEAQWETWYREARKEGKVVVIGSGEAAPRRAVGDAFRKKYGITVEDTTVRSALIAPKIMAERRAGLYVLDLIVAGTSHSFDLGAAVFESIKDVPILPEVVDPKVWWSGQIPYPIEDHTLIALMATPSVPLIVNTDLVKSGEEPKTWKDLLDPKWKGKIVMRDPLRGGSPQTLFTLLSYYEPELGLDFWRKLTNQELRIELDGRVMALAVARGKYPVGIAIDTAVVSEFIEIGAPIKRVKPEGLSPLSSASSNIGLVKNAPHPNAAKMLINFFMTREAGYLYSLNTGYQSGRVDVPTEHLAPDKLRQPGIKYIATGRSDFLAKEVEGKKDMIEIFK